MQTGLTDRALRAATGDLRRGLFVYMVVRRQTAREKPGPPLQELEGPKLRERALKFPVGRRGGGGGGRQMHHTRS